MMVPNMSTPEERTRHEADHSHTLRGVGVACLGKAKLTDIFF